MKRIEEFSTDDLLDELKARFSPFVFVGYKTEEYNDPIFWSDYGGNDALCYGLCHTLALEIQRKMVSIEVNKKIEE